MKLLNQAEPTRELMAALATCVAHRCVNHREIPPLNMNEGNGSSECGACVAETMGTEFASRALAISDETILFPVLDGYADRLTHHAVLVRALVRCRSQMMMAGLDVGFIDDAIG